MSSTEATRDELRVRALSLIDALADGGRDDDARDALLLDALRWQAAVVPPLARLLAARGVDLATARSPSDVPAVPTDVFKHVRVASHAESQDVCVFHTSGTTGTVPGRHAFSDLSLYDHAARVAAEHALFFDVPQMRLVMLAPDPPSAPTSSLSYMLGRFALWFGSATTWAWHDGKLDLDALASAIHEAEEEPVALLGTSFAFVHAAEGLGGKRFALPAGSRVMQTGGFKGLTRDIDPDVMRAELAERYGLDEERVVAEYGMTELSSQMYETTLREAADRWSSASAGPRRLWVPGWVRAVPVHPETLAPVPDGDVGILRIDDAANLGSVCAVQTSDLARRVDGDIELLGRAPGATPRGCSLAVDAILGGA